MGVNVFTRKDLASAMWLKGALTKHKTGNRLLYSVEHGERMPAAEMAELITMHGLDQVLTGYRHDGKSVNFARGFELCYGERLK